ncbi:fibronectin type III domain-containing protein [Flavobacterium sp. GT3R68]|uniref:fibronectin type III domain-containing protein n=1 Tax=Flavobacterium sp. GT3R68 TaxID=2594437 RepID=UPI000F898200|nr:hypothetical protein [Flavobacterium sp. GT3R68]RTY91382.1 hypothetical protein EKL32_19330 [Flavobacterium sp. GSN2]TRW94008.1 hypothetical protein FNW07_03595 [Flavobacterium sp. GT3R68]
MKKVLILVFVLLSIGAKAQDYKLFGAGGENKIQLKWMSKLIKSDVAFDIMKSEAGGTWQKINPTPIMPSAVIKESELKTAKNPFPKDESYAFYIKYKNVKEVSANKQAYSDYTLALAAIFDNEVAKHLGIYFEDNAVEKGKSYSYKLVDAKTQKQISVVNNLALGELPKAPENEKVAQLKQNVMITWSANEDYIGYNIYRNGTKLNKEPIMANLEKNVYIANYADANVPAGNYVYVLKGVTFLNTESKPSTDLKIVVKDITPPAVVKGFKGERKNDEVILTWTPSKDKEVAGYNIYKSDDKGKTFKKITAQTIKPSEAKYVEKLDKTTFGSLQYIVESVDQDNNGNRSVPIGVFVPDHEKPNMPNELKSKSEVGKITLSWRANSEKDLAGYRIYRGLKDDDQNDMLLLNATPQTGTSFVDVFNEKAGTKFIYKIAALDKSFNESDKAVVWVQLPDVIPPHAPILREANYDRNQVNLKWDAVLNDSILGYDVYRIVEGKEMKVNREPVTATNFSDSEMPARGICEYYVKAIDVAKLASKASNKLMVTKAVNPNQTIDLVATQDANSKKVQLKVQGIEPEAVLEAKLYRRKGDAGFLRIPFTVSDSLFTDETTELGVIYEYFLEVITTDDVKIKSEKIAVNNS